MSEPSGIRIYVRHMRSLGYCARAGKDWFAQNDHDWKDFLKNGLPIETAERIGDHPGLTVAAAARKEAEDGRRG
jgi:hypothetical protein